MAQLMFKIANEPQPDIRNFNPQVPESLVAVINRALCKDANERYQRGDEMASELRACLKPPKEKSTPDVDIAL